MQRIIKKHLNYGTWQLKPWRFTNQEAKRHALAGLLMLIYLYELHIIEVVGVQGSRGIKYVLFRHEHFGHEQDLVT